MPSLPIEQRLVHYFIAMGAQPVAGPEHITDRLIFNIGPTQIQVIVIKNEAFSRKGMIIESILRLSTARRTGCQLYLAAPRLLGATMDASIFKQYGIGLLLYDDRRLDEALPPQEYHPPIDPVQAGSTTDPILLAEFVRLKSMYADMEQHIAELKDSIKTLRDTAERTSLTPANLPPQETVYAHQPSFPTTENGNPLPSFFSNNPWLDLLSKRGREEGPIAG